MSSKAWSHRFPRAGSVEPAALLRAQMPSAARTSRGSRHAWQNCPSSCRRPSVPAPSPFEYAIVRVVPHVEREEFVNVGAILFCHAHDYLRARIALDEKRLLAIAPHVDL